jgi:5-methylcytosine-specific restriction endonuclease McrA
MSLAAIGRELGKDPSTVGYWVGKHGLAAAHADRHASRGGIDRGRLEQLLDDGRSIRQIADALGVSTGTVRHWMGRFGLETKRMARARARRAMPEGGPCTATADLTCAVHGLTTFHRRGERYRCGRCASDSVARRRRRVKEILVAEAGGCCSICGYRRYLGALEFHHLDPSAKQFGIGATGVTRSLEKARREAAKCVLLCANCHAEVEAGIVTVARAGMVESPV